MAKVSYTKRFDEVVDELKANGKYVKDENGYKLIIKKDTFDKIVEKVNDFCKLEEYSEKLKKYRSGSHQFWFRKGNYSGNIEIEFEVEVKEDKKVTVVIYDRVADVKVDWYEINENDVENDLADIKKQKASYKDCDIRVNGKVVLKF